MKKSIFTISLLSIMLLTACGGYTETGQVNNPNNPPAGAFSFSVSQGDLALTKGDTTGKELSITISFDEGYEHNVKLERNSATTGVSVQYGGVDLNELDLNMTKSETLVLTVKADGSAQSLNPFLELVAQGVTEKGSTRGLPRIQKTVNLTLN